MRTLSKQLPSKWKSFANFFFFEMKWHGRIEIGKDFSHFILDRCFFVWQKLAKKTHAHGKKHETETENMEQIHFWWFICRVLDIILRRNIFSVENSFEFVMLMCLFNEFTIKRIYETQKSSSVCAVMNFEWTGGGVFVFSFIHIWLIRLGTECRCHTCTYLINLNVNFMSLEQKEPNLSTKKPWANFKIPKANVASFSFELKSPSACRMHGRTRDK